MCADDAGVFFGSVASLEETMIAIDPVGLPLVLIFSGTKIESWCFLAYVTRGVKLDATASEP